MQGGKDDALVAVAPVLERSPDFTVLTNSGEDEEMSRKIRKAETIGRLVGSSDWLDEITKKLGRSVRPGKRGPKAKGVKEKSKLSP